MSPALAGEFLTPGPPGKSSFFLNYLYFVLRFQTENKFFYFVLPFQDYFGYPESFKFYVNVRIGLFYPSNAILI